MSGIPVKVSVVVPVYNVEKYLSACLSSCINQTLYDIEIICVNDGSTDGSLSILKQFAQRDHRIRIVDKTNGGLSSARNAGIRVARGSIIMFLDSDDYLSPNACERVWTETLEGPTDIVIFGTHIFPETPRASNWHYDVLRVPTHRRWGFDASVLFSEPSAKPFVWRQAFSKKLFDETKLEFDENVKYGEDMVFQMEMFPHAKNFSFIADPLYHYRWYREGSLMDGFRFDLDEKVEKHLSLAERICEYWEKQGWFKLYGKEFVQWALEFIVADIRSEETVRDPEHVAALNAILKKYGLEHYLNEMPSIVKPLVKTVNKGSR